MSLTCRKSMSIVVSPADDEYLDQAIFEPVSGKIYGVRGQWIMQFNPVSGEVEQKKRFTTNAWDSACITAHQGSLYCGVWRIPVNSFPNGWAGTTPAFPATDADIYQVDAALTTFTKTTISDYSFIDGDFGNGFHRLVSNGSLLFMRTDPIGLVSIDPANLATWASGHLSVGLTITDIMLDGNGYNYVPTPLEPDIWVADATFSNSGNADNFPASLRFPPSVFGLTYFPPDKVYGVTNGLTVVKMALAANLYDPHPWTTLSLGGNDSPIRLKYCPYPAPHPFAGKILIPTWSSDRIIVLDPATDTISGAYAGFSSPIDIVFTPSTAFAVQNQSPPLKEILTA